MHSLRCDNSTSDKDSLLVKRISCLSFAIGPKDEISRTSKFIFRENDIKKCVFEEHFPCKCVTIWNANVKSVKLFKTFKSVKLAKLSKTNVQCQSDNTSFSGLSFAFSSNFFSSSFAVFIQFDSHLLPELPFAKNARAKEERKKKPTAWFMLHGVSSDSVPLRACFLIQNLWFVVRLCRFDSKMFCHYWAFFFYSLLFVVAQHRHCTFVRCHECNSTRGRAGARSCVYLRNALPLQ